MNKKYIAPAISVVNTIVEDQFLVTSFKISNDTVDAGLVKEDVGEWEDIWDEE